MGASSLGSLRTDGLDSGLGVARMGQAREGLAMVSAFTTRATRTMHHLEQVSSLLPDTGIKSRKGMEIVTDQRKWLLGMFTMTGKFVGFMYALEKNMLHELRVFWETGAESAPLSMLKANCAATLANFQKMKESLCEGRKSMEKIEQHARRIPVDSGQGQALQDLLMEQLSEFAGGRQLEAQLEDMQKAMQEISEAQQEVQQHCTNLYKLQALSIKLSAQSSVLESVAAGEQRSMEAMAATAEKVEAAAKKKAQEAGQALNTATEIKIFGVLLWKSNENKGDSERWRAANLRKYAKQAKEDAKTQQDFAAEAGKKNGEVKGQLDATQAEIVDTKAELSKAQKRDAEAQEALRKLKNKHQLERDRFGGMSLQHIAELRHHFQRFPALIAPRNGEDAAMFSYMKGQMESHDRIIRRFEHFLTCTDTTEKALAALKSLRPAIKDAIRTSTFYKGQLGELEEKIKKDSERASFKHSLLDGDAVLRDSEGASRAASTGADPVVSLEDDDDDNPWS